MACITRFLKLKHTFWCRVWMRREQWIHEMLPKGHHQSSKWLQKICWHMREVVLIHQMLALWGLQIVCRALSKLNKIMTIETRHLARLGKACKLSWKRRRCSEEFKHNWRKMKTWIKMLSWAYQPKARTKWALISKTTMPWQSIISGQVIFSKQVISVRFLKTLLQALNLDIPPCREDKITI